jgi:hypothetical protein
VKKEQESGSGTSACGKGSFGTSGPCWPENCQGQTNMMKGVMISQLGQSPRDNSTNSPKKVQVNDDALIQLLTGLHFCARAVGSWREGEGGWGGGERGEGEREQQVVLE